MEAGGSSKEDTGLCVFCLRKDLSSAETGDTLRKDGITVHQNCLYFSSGLAQNGDGDSDGICGFLVTDILSEVKRATRKNFRCMVCKEPGLFVGCSITSCSKGGHYPCLLQHGYLFQHCGTFNAYCPRHAPTQPPLPSPNESCCICLSPFSSDTGLYCPSCKTTFHRTCIQKQAWTAGMYFFRCPICNNEDQYTQEMLRMGVALPDRDAKWESDDYFGSQLEDTKFCQAQVCKCPNGRDHHMKIGKYRLRKCMTCGQWIGHVCCLNGRPKECLICASVDTKLEGSSHATASDHSKSSSSMNFDPPHTSYPCAQPSATCTPAMSKDSTTSSVKNSSSRRLRSTHKNCKTISRRSVATRNRSVTVSYSRKLIPKLRSRVKLLTPCLVVHRMSAEEIEQATRKKSIVESSIPLDVGGSLHTSGALDEGGSQHTSGALDEGGSLHTSGALDEGGSLHTSGALDEGGSLHTSGALDEGGSLHTSGAFDEGGSLHTSGALDEGGSLQTSRPVHEGGSLQTDIPLYVGGSLQTSRPLYVGGSLQTSGPPYEGSLQTSRPLYEGVSLQMNRPLYVGGSLQMSRPLYEGGFLQTSRPLYEGGSLQANRPVYEGGSLQASRPVYEGGSPQMSRPLYEGGSPQMSRPLYKGESPQMSRPLYEGGSLQTSRPLYEGGSLQTSRPLYEGGSLQTSRPVGLNCSIFGERSRESLTVVNWSGVAPLESIWVITKPADNHEFKFCFSRVYPTNIR